MSDHQHQSNRVTRLRLVVEAEDYDAAVAFYRDALGLAEELAGEGSEGAHVTILSAGRATLEIANPKQKAVHRPGRGGTPRCAQDPGRVRGRRHNRCNRAAARRRCGAHRTPD